MSPKPASLPRSTVPAQGGKNWDKALRDPLVQKVREAVDGTLLDVRPAAGAVGPADAQPAAGAADDSVETEPTMEA